MHKYRLHGNRKYIFSPSICRFFVDLNVAVAATAPGAAAEHEVTALLTYSEYLINFFFDVHFSAGLWPWQ